MPENKGRYEPLGSRPSAGDNDRSRSPEGQLRVRPGPPGLGRISAPQLVVDGQGDKEKKRRIYDCFVYETAHKAQTYYVLFSGEWYCVEDKFFNAVDADFQALLGVTC